tara:strand:+ start:1199 stop:1741 length:543 start_codon:yes stop_codon:yes gene_type:complete
MVSSEDDSFDFNSIIPNISEFSWTIFFVIVFLYCAWVGGGDNINPGAKKNIVVFGFPIIFFYCLGLLYYSNIKGYEDFYKPMYQMYIIVLGLLISSYFYVSSYNNKIIMLLTFLFWIIYFLNATYIINKKYNYKTNIRNQSIIFFNILTVVFTIFILYLSFQYNIMKNNSLSVKKILLKV